MRSCYNCVQVACGIDDTYALTDWSSDIILDTHASGPSVKRARWKHQTRLSLSLKLISDVRPWSYSGVDPEPSRMEGVSVTTKLDGTTGWSLLMQLATINSARQLRRETCLLSVDSKPIPYTKFHESESRVQSLMSARLTGRPEAWAQSEVRKAVSRNKWTESMTQNWWSGIYSF